MIPIATYLIKSTDSMNEVPLWPSYLSTNLIFEDMSCDEPDDDKSSHIGTYSSYLFFSLDIILHLLSTEMHVSHHSVC